MRALPILGLVLIMSPCACTSGSPSAGRGGGTANEITAAEIESYSGVSAYDVISRLRPQWLRGRSGTFTADDGRNYPSVFMDGRPWGAIDSLQQIDVSQIERIRFISPTDATMRFGTGYPSGIIDVITRG